MQIIVYAGAIVVLFLFVIMLLGVDRADSLHDPVRFQRPTALALGAILLAELLFLGGHTWATGAAQSDDAQMLHGGASVGNNIERVARVPVHRLPLAVRAHRGAARARGRRRRRARAPQR